MGCNQLGTSHHNREEGQGQSQHRVAREICCPGCYHNVDICGGYKVPHRQSIIIIRKSGCGRGTCPCPCLSDSTSLSEVSPLSCMSSVHGPSPIIPIHIPPGLKPSQSPFLPTMRNHFLQHPSKIWGLI